MIFGLSYHVWYWVLGAGFVLIGFPALLGFRWLRKHQDSKWYTRIVIGAGVVCGSLVIARFHNVSMVLVCLALVACLYADARKRHGKGLLPHGDE